MPRALGRALLALAVPLLLAAGAPELAAASWLPMTLTGTYELLAKDVLDEHGDLTHVYSDVLRVPGRAIPIRLPAGHGLRGGTPIRLSAQRTYGATSYAVSSFQQIAPASVIGSAGTTSVLVILAYWTAPDAVTTTRATSQIFGDDDRWFREVSYGKAGLAGVATPWLRIPAPVDGKCFAGAEALMAAAKAKAAALGAKYDATAYDRTILYFPRCAGGDTANTAGWAYEPGSSVWLNGVMDRRTTVHEQGHNYGLGHAKSLSCRSSAGVRVTFSGACTASEYGDPYDAMGRSAYAAHFTGYRKDAAGWLGSRKRVLTTSSATFTLPPFEKVSTLPLVVVARSPVRATRSYWLEYRRPVGMDARLPAGATGGVLVHLVDTGRPGMLLDGTPSDGSMTTAVLKAGTSWIAPDHVKISVGAISSTGAKVSITGAKLAPAPPSTPRSFTAKAGDARIDLTWVAPSSTGGAPITSYEVVASTRQQTVEEVVDGGTRSASVTGLVNGERYTISIRARNSGGLSPAAVAYATPFPMPPSVVLTAPVAGAVVAGLLRFEAAATPHPVTQSPISCLYFYVDDVKRASTCGAPSGTASWDSAQLPNGPHAVKVVATDRRARSGTAGPVTVEFRNPLPVVAITSPASGSSLNTETVSLEAAASVPLDPAAGISSVTYYDVTEGWNQYIGSSRSAPYHVDWGVTWVTGTRQVVAVAVASNGHQSRSAPVAVTVVHPPSTIRITSPAAYGTVKGTQVTVTAAATVTASGVGIDRVVFYDDARLLGEDREAPFEAVWDISGLTGSHYLEAFVVETSGRVATAQRVHVTVANVLPAVAITWPGPDAWAMPGTVTLRGTAAAGAGGAVPDRVRVRVAGADAGVAPVVNGAWSLPWDSGTALGYLWVEARSMTPAGLVSEPAYAEVHVSRPRPSGTLESPVDGAVLRTADYLHAVVAAAPGAGDPNTVESVCLRNLTEYNVYCSSTRTADGTFSVGWSVSSTPGTYDLSVEVVMSDGARFTTDTATVTAAAPPRAPGLTVTPRDGGLTVYLTMPPSSSGALPHTGYVVYVDGRRFQVTGFYVVLSVGGLVNGQQYRVDAVATNAVGEGAASTAYATPEAPSASAAQAVLTPLWVLPATALGRRRRAAARP